jgi:hypothetical protein
VEETGRTQRPFALYLRDRTGRQSVTDDR